MSPLDSLYARVKSLLSEPFLTLSNAALQRETRVIAYPSKWYVKQERFNPDDWVVEFYIPQDARYERTYCECDTSKRIFALSRAFPNEGVVDGKQLIRVIAGGRAHLGSGYSIEDWARVWRVSYFAPFEPRGPAPRPRRPPTSE